MSRVEIKKAGNCFTVEILTSKELAMRITSNGEVETTIFEKIVSYEALDAEMKYLFQNISFRKYSKKIKIISIKNHPFMLYFCIKLANVEDPYSFMHFYARVVNYLAGKMHRE
jgi:hypothetical protein